MYFVCLLIIINAVYEVYPPKNKENVNIPAVKMTSNKESSNEGFENKLSFSVVLCMRVYYVRNTDSELY